jgi:hypothetical protein
MNIQKHIDPFFRQKRAWFFPVWGLAFLIWFLIRVVPKPNRISYPCQRAAAPVAAGFLMWVTGLLTSSVLFHRTRRFWMKSRSAISLLSLVFAFIFLFFTLVDSPSIPLYANRTANTFTDPPNQPMGQAMGIHPGRVVFTHDSTAARWNGGTGYWWSDRNTNLSAVSLMLSQSIQSLTGESDDAKAWDSLFRHFNKSHGKGETGYRSGERIAVKLNLVNCRLRGHSSNYGNSIYAAPQVVLALLRQLVGAAGVPDSMITFFDANMEIPYTISQRCFDEFPNVHFVDFIGGDGCEKSKRDTRVQIRWSQKLVLSSDNGGGNPAFIPTCVTRADYLVNLANLKGHGGAGVTFCAKNLFGCFCADLNGRPTRYAPVGVGLHPYIVTVPLWGRPVREKGSYNPMVDLMGHGQLGEKTLLYMIDALYAVRVEEGVISLEDKWQSAPFDNGWTSSLFLSQDGVALESVAFDFFRSEPTIAELLQQVGGDINNVDNYLHEAALADNAPSGTVYDPEGDGIPLASLGVHEHWNNAADRQYSRNLGTGDGIELVSVQTTTSVRTKDAQKSLPDYMMLKSYPNPFNSSTVFTFSMPKAGPVKLRILDVLGREIVCLIDETVPSGERTLRWDGTDLRGNLLNSGTYIACLETEGVRRSVAKLLLTR